MSKSIYYDEIGSPCRGNFPGLCSSTILASGCVVFYRTSTSCGDGSDNIACTANVDCEAKGMFRCADNSTCLPESIVCDGYAQCADGSDEDEGVCMDCSRNRYFPKFRQNDTWTATFQVGMRTFPFECRRFTQTSINST